MPSPADEAAAVLRELDAEHQELHALFDEVGGAEDVVELARRLEALYDRLERHFADEERPGGAYSTLGARDDGAVVETLVEEHHRLLAAGRTLLGRAQRAGEHDRGVLLGAAAELMESLRAHEAHETGLLEAEGP